MGEKIIKMVGKELPLPRDIARSSKCFDLAAQRAECSSMQKGSTGIFSGTGVGMPFFMRILTSSDGDTQSREVETNTQKTGRQERKGERRISCRAPTCWQTTRCFHTAGHSKAGVRYRKRGRGGDNEGEEVYISLLTNIRLFLTLWCFSSCSAYFSCMNVHNYNTFRIQNYSWKSAFVSR
jgi:hypothetical protein